MEELFTKNELTDFKFNQLEKEYIYNSFKKYEAFAKQMNNSAVVFVSFYNVLKTIASKTGSVKYIFIITMWVFIASLFILLFIIYNGLNFSPFLIYIFYIIAIIVLLYKVFIVKMKF